MSNPAPRSQTLHVVGRPACHVIDDAGKLLASPPRFNRAVFRSGATFHSGGILAPDFPGANPHHGRLILNGSFTCQRTPS